MTTTAMQVQVAERTAAGLARSAYSARVWVGDSGEVRVYVTGPACGDSSYIWVGADGSRSYGDVANGARAAVLDAIRAHAPKSAVQS